MHFGGPAQISILAGGVADAKPSLERDAGADVPSRVVFRRLRSPGPSKNFFTDQRLACALADASPPLASGRAGLAAARVQK